MNLQNLIDYSKIYNEPNPLYGVDLPDPLDNEKCKSAIMMRCGLLEPVYGDPAIFREMLYTWFKTHDWTFKHLIAIIQAEYSPIENTDRYSEHEITTSGKDSRQKSGTDNRTIATAELDNRTRTPNLKDSTEDTISAENSGSYQPDSKHETNRTGTETTAGTHNEDIKDDLTRSENESGSRSGNEKYIEHTHGNIGVTTNTQLINEELELLRRFNVYDWIAERIEEEFFIMVY